MTFAILFGLTLTPHVPQPIQEQVAVEQSRPIIVWLGMPRMYPGRLMNCCHWKLMSFDGVAGPAIIVGHVVSDTTFVIARLDCNATLQEIQNILEPPEMAESDVRDEEDSQLACGRRNRGGEGEEKSSGRRSRSKRERGGRRGGDKETKHSCSC